jgi:hypothetical protein
MELYLYIPRTRSLSGQSQLYRYKSVVRLRTVDAQTCEVEATTALQKQSADLESGGYIHVYLIYTCMNTIIKQLCECCIPQV